MIQRSVINNTIAVVVVVLLLSACSGGGKTSFYAQGGDTVRFRYLENLTLVDYEDYLRVRGLVQWGLDSEKMQQTRTFCRAHSDSAVYREAMPNRSAETIANIALVLIHQTDVLIDKYIEDLKQDFLKNGGVREEMSRARRAVREEK